ncbi:MAG: hypothetical protein DI565_03850 [Ancylobacter novellus]|uniref:AMP-dependent synthetase/ligase domain-containing protein n=1 Tax=Ancylobacter novellus TaxID=921 RepID=A0A2W5MJT4_ANCNO|nr:MAG: hypothetical protein DI565_03850 [Ancylobacter novellus]
MRLAPYASDPLPNPAAGDRTLDEILAANADRAPDARALHAPELGFEPSWREVDRAVSALAETFAGWSLGEDAVVGVQLGSSPHAAIACLALRRAGLVPAMLPLAWRRREVGAALASVGATAIVAAAGGGGGAPAETGCEVAAGLDTIRFVGCFGEPLPDGATPLDDALDRPAKRFVRPDRPEDAADHVAVVTFDAGGTPVARSHNDVSALGLAPILASRLSTQSALLSTLDLAGLAGLATGLAPWLLSGCAASFHAVSSTGTLRDTVEALDATHIVLPGRAAATILAELGLGERRLTATALWRAPDGRGPAADLAGAAAIVDAFAFGEVGLYAAARAARERHAALPVGAASPAEGVDPLIEFKVSAEGRLLLRGPACPQAPCPANPMAPPLAFDPDGYVETGFAAVADRAARRVSLGGRRRGVAQIGGLALSLADVETAWKRSGVRGAPALVDDPLFGARLELSAGAEDDDAAAAATLETAGFGPATAPRRPASRSDETTLRSA